MLFDPVVKLKPEFVPKNELEFPIVLPIPEFVPKKVLFTPVVF